MSICGIQATRKYFVVGSVYRNRTGSSKDNYTKVPRSGNGSGDFVRSGSSRDGSTSERHSRLGTYVRTVSTGSTGGSRSDIRTRTQMVHRPKLTPAEKQEKAIETRARRFRLQSEAARLLPGEKVAKCQREIVPVAAGVAVQHSPATKSAHFSGLQCCSSIWHCPVCAAKISERRRVELEKIDKQHIALGGSIYMTTYTISHKKYDVLAELLQRFLAARRRMKQGRRAQGAKDEFQICGTVSVLEVTWSADNGWHVHVHELVFCMLPRMDEEGYEAYAREAWRKAAEREGLGMNEHGFKLDRTYGAVADYIAKFGHEPEKDRPVWGTETEMTKSHIKMGRGSEHYTPFALLAAIADGHDELRPIFVEYAQWFKGHKQLTYSPGLKSFYNLEEKSDEELALEQEQEAVTLVLLDREQWAAVLGNDIRAELLEVARSGSAALVVAFLAGFGIEAVAWVADESEDG